MSSHHVSEDLVDKRSSPPTPTTRQRTDANPIYGTERPVKLSNQGVTPKDKDAHKALAVEHMSNSWAEIPNASEWLEKFANKKGADLTSRQKDTVTKGSLDEYLKKFNETRAQSKIATKTKAKIPKPPSMNTISETTTYPFMARSAIFPYHTMLIIHTVQGHQRSFEAQIYQERTARLSGYRQLARAVNRR